MPAVAVIHEGQALFVFIGCKGYVGSFFNFFLNLGIINLNRDFNYYNLSYKVVNRICKVGVISVDIIRNTKSEGS